MGKKTVASENRPISATISDKNGKERTVQYKDLKPAATPRPGHFFTREMPEEGSLIIWEEKENLKPGMIMSTDPVKGTVMAHQYRATKETSLYWIPIWKSQDGKDIRAKVAPPSSTAATVHVNASSVKLVGELTMTFTMSKATRKEALARLLI